MTGPAFGGNRKGHAIGRIVIAYAPVAADQVVELRDGSRRSGEGRPFRKCHEFQCCA
jgi:hypothetical protein